MDDDDRDRLYQRDTRWYRQANPRSGARLLDILSTDLLEPASRFPFWSEVVCRTFTMLDCRAAERAAFRAKLWHVRQGERSRLMSPGELDVVQTDRPYVLEFPRLFSQYVIKLPRSERPVGVITPTAARFVRSLARDLLDPDIEPDAICDEVAVQAVQELLCGPARQQPRYHRTPDLYGMAMAIVRETILDPLMSRDRVAKELGVSVRTLARAFAMHGTTFDRSFWNCRLEAACEALLSNSGNKSITEVALRHGFSDSSHFTRRFKTRFGATPGSMLNR